MRIWYNHGYSQTRDALVLLRRAQRSGLTLVASSSNPMSPVMTEADVFAIEPSIDRSTNDGRSAYVDWCLEFAREQLIDVFVV